LNFFRIRNGLYRTLAAVLSAAYCTNAFNMNEIQPVKRVKRVEGGPRGFGRLYDGFLIRVDITEVEECKWVVREVEKDSKVMEQFERVFLKGRYGETQEYIAVTIIGMSNEQVQEFRRAVDGNQVAWQGSTKAFLKKNNRRRTGE